MPADPPKPDPRRAARVPPPKPDDARPPEETVADAIAARDALGAGATADAGTTLPEHAAARAAGAGTGPPSAAASVSDLLSRVPRDRPAALLDVAVGSGEGVLAIVRRARRIGRPLHVVVSDPDGFRLRAAREALGHLPEVEFRELDPLRVDLPDRAFDVVVCSRPLPSVAPDDPAALLREMARLARVGLAFRERRPPRRPTLADMVDRVAGRSVPRPGPVSAERMAAWLEQAGLAGAAVTRLPERGVVVVTLPPE